MDWICVHLDKVGLWTASLIRGGFRVEDLGGSYPGSRSCVIDSKNTWGKDLSLKIIPNYAPIVEAEDYKGEV